MAFDELMADRIRSILIEKGSDFYEKKMFGGLCFMVDEKMCVGINKEDVMARIHPDKVDEALDKPGARPMDFTGRPMKGFIFIGPEGTDMDDDLAYWVQLSLDFNPYAKASKKKSKK